MPCSLTMADYVYKTQIPDDEKSLELKQSVKKQNTSRTLCFVKLVLFSLNIILVTLNSLVGYYYYYDKTYSLPSLGDTYLEHISLLCEDLSLSPDDDDETFRGLKVSVNDYGRYVCTYENDKMLSAIKTFVERRSRLRLAKGLDSRQYLSCGNESLAVASGYLTASFSGVSRHQVFERNSMDVILHWDKHPERSYISSGIQYHNGQIHIPERRVYFAYASIHFKISRTSNIKRPLFYSLRICRKLFNTEETLLWKNQFYDVEEDNVVSSLHIGGYLLLSRDDLIYVKVYNANATIKESTGNTFGLFPL